MLIEVKEVEVINNSKDPAKKKKKVVICECDFCHKVFEHVSRDNHPSRVINQKEHFCCNEHRKAHAKHLTPEDLLSDEEKFANDEKYQEYMKQSQVLPIFVSRKRI